MNAKTLANKDLELVLEKYAQLSMFEGYDIFAPDSCGPDGDTPFHMVAYDGDIAAATIMLPYISDINFGGDIGNSPLHYAIINKQPEMTKFLISHGADVLKKNDYGDTPIDGMQEDSIFHNILSEFNLFPKA